MSHRQSVQTLLTEAAAEHAALLEQLPQELRASLPVDGQGVTRAIEHLAQAAGLDAEQRRQLIRPHALNPAVLHARVFGGAGLTRDTVIASFVEGARVRADALTSLADTAGGDPLGRAVRAVLIEAPPPAAGGDLAALKATYAAQERAALLIAAALDAE